MTDKSQASKAFVPRITQLDALEFDQEIHNILFKQLMEVSKHLTPGALNNTKLEINLILDFLIFYCSVVNKNATFGQELLGLKYKKLLSGVQVAFYAFTNCIIPYLNNRNKRLIIFPFLWPPFKNAVDKLKVFIAISSAFNTLIFLREGKYPTIVDRILKLTYSPVDRVNRSVGYNYMTRELLWHGFQELLMSILPLINYKAIKRKIRKPFIIKSLQIKHEKITVYNSEIKCVICDDFSVLPCQISSYCPHLACYYCLQSNVLADDKFMCPVCEETNTVNENLKFLAG